MRYAASRRLLAFTPVMVLVVAASACGVARPRDAVHAPTPQTASAAAFRGPWLFTMGRAEGAEFVLRLTVVRAHADEWTAHSRPGAAAEFVGRGRAIAGRLLGRMPPHGALVNVTDGRMHASGDTTFVHGRLRSALLGNFHLRGSLVDGTLEGELRRDSLGPVAWTVRASPQTTPATVRDYAALARRIEQSFRERIYDPALVETPAFRRFFRELPARMARAHDDSDALAAFYALRPRLPLTHIELFRDPVMAALPLDSLIARSGDEQLVFLSFPAPGVALLRVTRWNAVAAEVTRAFERIDSAAAHTLLLDIRSNPGGDVTSMAPAAHLLSDSTVVGVFLGRRWYAARRTPPSRADMDTLPVISDATALTLIHAVSERGAIVGVVPPLSPRFAGETFLLINGRSGSASEPLAHLLRTTGRATLIGERTAGAMLSGPPRPVGDGWILVVPEADYFAADGSRLEGAGVPPHVETASDRALNAAAERLRARHPYAAALLDGVGHVEAARWPDAVGAYTRAQALAPDSIAPALGLGRAHTELQEWEAAFAAYDRVIAVRPGHLPALYQIGRLAALSRERLSAGESALREYLRHDPPDGSPSHAAAQWRLGMILEAAGRRDEALTAYQTAVTLDPQSVAYREALARLQR